MHKMQFGCPMYGQVCKRDYTLHLKMAFFYLFRLVKNFLLFIGPSPITIDVLRFKEAVFMMSTR